MLHAQLMGRLKSHQLELDGGEEEVQSVRMAR
jgi:hypothetical protein